MLTFISLAFYETFLEEEILENLISCLILGLLETRAEYIKAADLFLDVYLTYDITHKNGMNFNTTVSFS